MREYALVLEAHKSEIEAIQKQKSVSSIKEAIAKIRGIKKRLVANSLTLVGKSKTKIEQQSGP